VTCPSLSTAAAWALGELEPADEQAFEEHYFACAACEARVVQIQRVLRTLHESLPPVLTIQRRRALEGRHTTIQNVPVKPGGRGVIHLGPSAPIGLWVMSADLRDASRVDFEGMSSDGEVFLSIADVPFDRERGEVVLACQEHYRNLPGPTEMHVRLTSTSADGTKRATDYVLDHRFESQ